MFKGVQFLTINKLKLGDLSLNIYHIMLYMYKLIQSIHNLKQKPIVSK